MSNPKPGAEGAARRGLGWATREIAERASAVVKLELELAAIEVRGRLRSLAAGIALAVTAAVLLLFLVGFGLAAIAAGIASWLAVWAALLVVTGGLLVAVVLLGGAAVQLLRSGRPVPEQAIEEARLTTKAIRGNGGSSER